ncbi:syntaxin-1A [Fopius arisanus]|uniref:STX1B protein n=1 Tax=Fopius arisanus TaxID=64838 RepID=A0A0C9R1X3_9HYME|nr:PREDICTED: syntaxin-1A-like [Fopius arisanus]
MIRDRLPDLCARRRRDSNFGRGLLQDVCIQIGQNKRVKDILEQAEKIRGMLDILQDNVNIVKKLHNNELLHTNPDMQTELEGRTFIISQTSVKIRTSLKDMSKDIPNFEELTLDAAREGTAHARIRVLQYVTSFELFSEIMREYNDAIMKYHAKCSSIYHQQKRLLRKENASQYIESDPEEGEKVSLFVDNILEESRIAKAQLSEIQMRHTEMMKLEKSLTEIRGIFVEMAFAVEKQGEQLNCVEHFAGQATDNVDSGKTDISKAERRKNRYRKRKIKCLSILVVIMLILLLIVIFL